MHGALALLVLAGYVLYFDGSDRLRVRDGKRSAPLVVQGSQPVKWSTEDFVRGPGTVTVSHMPACEDLVETFTDAQLEARLVLAEAQRHHKRGRLEDAVQGFTDARALDPALATAEHGLVRALLALDRVDEALIVLSPRLAAEPLALYVEIATDPALARLRTRDEITRLRPATAGTARVTARGALGTSGIAVSPGGWIATVESVGNHGACFASTSIVLRESSNLARKASLDIIHERDFEGDGCDEHGDGLTAAGRKAIAARAAAASRILAELGFASTTQIAGTLLTHGSGKHRVRFGTTGLGLVIGEDGAARFFRGKQLLAEHPAGTVRITRYFQDAFLLPDEHRVLVSTMDHGCEWAEINATVSIPLPRE